MRLTIDEHHSPGRRGGETERDGEDVGEVAVDERHHELRVVRAVARAGFWTGGEDEFVRVQVAALSVHDATGSG
jgi:hypothetical protein